jgi:outer membrane protein assembly factor BamB
LIGLAMAAAAAAADQPQWGQRFSRNMVSDEKNLPDSFDPASGKNIKWVARLGNETHGTPVVAGGRVLVGTNNAEPRDPRHQGDRGVLMCFDEKDGKFLWQLIVPKIGGDVYLDWPSAGLCSPPTVEGDRVYVLSNRAEVLCLDLAGQANGNGGPFLDEGRLMAPKGASSMAVTPIDADVLWLFDLVSGTGIWTHDAAHTSVLVDGPFLYINTGNGVDNTHRKIRRPDAPALVVLDKATGRLLARDAEHMGPRTVHCTWSSPALGEVNGRRLIFLGGPDGVVYAFEPLAAAPPPGEVANLKCVWRFDCDPTAPKENVHQYMGNRRESASNIKSMPVFYKNRVYVTVGGDMWWGKNQAWLKCIDATKTGDVTRSGELWSYPLKMHCCSTPAIANGLAFVVDCGRTIHCVDAETGRPCWTQETKGEFWASPVVADGKVYVGTKRGDFWILAAEKEKKVLGTIQMDSSMSSSPVVANGVLYITTQTRLYAVQKKPK